ncbi:2,3-diaminopropionate biosynthesis protein SbnA [Paenibacillus sp. LHD-117]|uniref:2,3-diaminopropionate biosynthesis protein SbnA n=1 Tax=Paenibacillus sp. LHD-117 TaxID=3071412 RepID=UPI0027E124D0|nr:2,3-diaminopropionate biosynthesis protein SbnA [Paenibacillus sp. LHD-117]MDQ6423344.1 2,3-diaminopropionate biosynthesis protein SbnA [Paenibacillus sp. LHD-117]
MRDSWLNQIGGTPLVRLSRLFPEQRGIRAYAKLELMNPSGSAKDRPALRILEHAWKDGRIGPGSVVVESSSGNMAISMAAICRLLGLKFICVIDPRTAKQNIEIMKAYGAEVSYVADPDPATGEFLPARLQRVQELLALTPDGFWPNQYGNPHNYLAHSEGTMPEIVRELGRVDYVIGGVSTCGTMFGCSAYIHASGLPTKVVAVDAVGSVIFGGEKGPRKFPGLGAGIVPPFAMERFMDMAISVTDREMAIACRELAAAESILAGPSSGAVIAALQSIIGELPDGSVCAAILHDRGERYMDTVFNDEWMETAFGPL